MGVHTRLMPPHRREVIEAEIEMHLQRVTLLIARLDRADGDVDLELNGDELDGANAEDDFGVRTPPWAGPGCLIADGDLEHDGREPEWGI